MNKKAIATGLVCFILGALFINPVFGATAIMNYVLTKTDYKVFVNDKEFDGGSVPAALNYKGVYYIPLNEVAGELGIDSKIELTPGKINLTVAGGQKTMDINQVETTLPKEDISTITATPTNTPAATPIPTTFKPLFSIPTRPAATPNPDDYLPKTRIVNQYDGMTIDTWEGKEYLSWFLIRAKAQQHGYDLTGYTLDGKTYWKFHRQALTMIDNVPTLIVFGYDCIELSYYKKYIEHYLK